MLEWIPTDLAAVSVVLVVFVIFGSVCIYLPMRAIAAARRKRLFILKGSADYLLASHSLQPALREVVSILLGEATDEEVELGRLRMRYSLSIDQGICVVQQESTGRWQAPSVSLPDPERYRQVAARLAESGDVRLIRPLSELQWFHGRERDVARYALVDLLKVVGREDSMLLSQSSVFSHLSPRHCYQPQDRILVLEILAAVKRSEHTGALNHVRRLITHDETPASVRAKAEQCFALLKNRMEQEWAGRTLLRPSIADDDSLLRPTSFVDDSDPSLLLRSHNP